MLTPNRLPSSWKSTPAFSSREYRRTDHRGWRAVAFFETLQRGTGDTRRLR
jgi:hypothetical protein